MSLAGGHRLRWWMCPRVWHISPIPFLTAPPHATGPLVPLAIPTELSLSTPQGSVDQQYDEDLGELDDLTGRHSWSNEVLCASILDFVTALSPLEAIEAMCALVQRSPQCTRRSEHSVEDLAGSGLRRVGAVQSVESSVAALSESATRQQADVVEVCPIAVENFGERCSRCQRTAIQLGNGSSIAWRKVSERRIHLPVPSATLAVPNTIRTVFSVCRTLW